MNEKNFLRAAKEIQRVEKKAQEKLSKQKEIDIGGGWLIYFKDEFIMLSWETSWDSGNIITYFLKFEYETAFIRIPQAISFFREKIKSLFNKNPEELQIEKGKNVFAEIKRINRILGREDNDGKMIDRYLIKVSSFNNIQFYSLNKNINCDMPWETFFVKLPEALSKMKVQYEKIGGGEIECK